MARLDKRRKRSWRYRLNEDTILEVSAPRGATERQVRRRGRVSLVLATLTAALAASAVAGGAVSTDKADYSPGEVVTISGDNSDGAGYLAGEVVEVSVEGPNGYAASCEAVADDNGAWSCEITLWGTYLAWGTYSFAAAGQTSGVTETGSFTDALNTGSFASNCVTPQDSFSTGSTVCMKLTGLGNSASGVIKWWQPGLTPAVDTPTRTTNYGPANGSTTDSHQVSDCGTWNVIVTASAVTGGPSDFDDTFEVTGCAPANTAPTVASLTGATPVEEHATTERTYSFSFSDPNANTWSFVSGHPACGAGGSLVSGSATIDQTAKTGEFKCVFDDGPASPTLAVKIFDGTDQSNEATLPVTVENVAPSGTFNTPLTGVNEGSTFNLTFSGISDPSGADTTAGFQYKFDCGTGYGSYDTSDSTTCNTATDGPTTLAVKGMVKDKDNGEREYTGSVTVVNVKPSVTIDSLTGVDGVACIGGNQVTLGFSWTDPAESNDTYSYDVNWGDGSAPATDTSATSPVSGLTHTYAAGGPYTIVVTVNDEDADAGSTASSTAFSFLYAASGVLQPVNDTQGQNDPSVFKYGSTVPVKIRVTDCNNVVVTGLTPQIAVKKIAGSTPLSGFDETIASTSGADSGTTMRYSDGIYIYNLATKSLADSSATYEIRITGPFNTVTATFGTRPK